MINERELVLDSLIEILEKGELSHKIEKAVLDKHDYLLANEKAFIKRLTEGTIENLLSIDAVIDQYANTKVAKQKPLIRNLLRLSVYQILFMDKIPDRAAINEAVKLAGKRGFRTLGGFVNGILRNISRDKDRIICNLPDNMPEWIKNHFISEFGEEKARIILADMEKEHPVTLRIRSKLKSYEDFDKADTEFFVKALDNSFVDIIEPSVYYLKKGKSVKAAEGYTEGAFVVQDVAGMSVCALAGIKKGDRVLDVCAAPGGKAINACDMGATVRARDISEAKTRIIDENIVRLGVGNITTEVFDATVLDGSLIESMDVVIADVPCSGLGVIGRKSDIKFKTRPEDLEELPILQRKIIDTVQAYVKKGGVLMYSTCTLNKKENENQVNYIVDNYPFVLEKDHLFLPGIEPVDGFYVARLRRK